MAANGVQELDLKDLDAVLERAKAEGWTELALGGPATASRMYLSRLLRTGWSCNRVFALSQDLEHVPPALAKLSSLTSLYLAHSQIGNAGARAIAGLTSLTSLDLEHNQIGDSGAEAIATLTGLTSLRLPFNRIGEAGAMAIASLTGLTSLDLEANRIGNEGAKAIASLTGLTTLNLIQINLSEAGAMAIASLTGLTSLDLAGNWFGDAGATAIASLSGLKSLNLAINEIGEAGAKAIASLSSLTSLDLSHNELSDAGATAIASLSGLTSLSLANNQMGYAGAKAIAGLSDLTALDLAGNQIGEAGAMAIASLSGLKSLNLTANRIGDLGTTAIAALAELTSLNLWRNQIGDTGAKAIAGLTGLTSLVLGENQVGDAGAMAIAKLTGLKSLHLWGNQIGEAGARAILDAWADPTTADRRCELHLKDSGDFGGLLPAEVLEQTDAQALIAAWRRFREAEAKGELRPLNEAKVLVLGNEAVGKTSLVRFLVDRLPRNDSEKKTAGIVIRRDVAIDDWSAEGSAVRLHFWDFGGQEIMHQTHRYFLTRRSLYLVVLEDRREDDRSVYDWLKVIRSRGGESPVLIVINKCDMGAPNLRLDETGIQAAYPNVVGFVSASCNPDGEARIAGLRQQIAALVAGDPRLTHVRDPFPPEQLRVKRAVAAAAEEARYLERAAFVRLCEAADEPGSRITDPALQRSLLQLLHDLGTVVAHGLERERSDSAREVTLLDPNWLTEAIYRLLNSKRILNQGGAFGRDEMAAELDPERYPPERHGYIVDMMQEPEIGLCFRLPGQGERWLMPECLPTNGPDVDVFFDNALRFRFRYEFLPIGLMPRFIVEAYNRSTDQPTRWRTGVLLGTAGCMVLAKADLDRSIIDLAVTGPEARRRSALDGVLHDLEAVHRLYPEIGTEARVPLPDEPEVDVGYEDLSKWEAVEGADYSFWPEKANRKYTVGELLAGVRVESGRRVLPEPVVSPTVAAPAQGLAGYWWFPLACGAAAMALAGLLMLLPTNEWRAVVGGVAGVGIAVTLLATHFAPGRFYRRTMAWTISVGFLIHAAGSWAEAGYWGQAAARLQWDGRVSFGFSLAWMVIVVGLIVADMKQTSK